MNAKNRNKHRALVVAQALEPRMLLAGVVARDLGVTPDGFSSGATVGNTYFFAGTNFTRGSELRMTNGIIAAPSVAATTFDPSSAATPAVLQSLRFRFNEDLAASTISAGDLSLMNLTTSTTIATSSIAASYDAPTRSAVFQFINLPGGVLPSGSYSATIAAGAISDDVGNPTTAAINYRFIWVAGSAAGELFTVINNGGTRDVRLNGSSSASFSATASTLGAIAIGAGGGDDTLAIDMQFGTPVPHDGLRFDGAAGNDTIAVLGFNLEPDSVSFSPSSIITPNGREARHTATESFRYDGRTGFDTLAVSGVGVMLPVIQKLASLTLASGAVVTAAVGGSATIVAKSLSIASDSKLDLNDNNLILDYTTGSQLAAVQSLINSARAGAAWTGNGITSTVARNAQPRIRTLAAMEASDFKSIPGNADARFAGQIVDTTSVLVKFAYYGDANFDNRVNFDDYTRIDRGFINTRTGWLNGDFNGDGRINFDDYTLIDSAFNALGAQPSPIVSKPRAHK